MAKTHQRVFAMIAALLFLGTSVAFSIVVVVQMRKQSSTDNTQAQAIQDQTNQSTSEAKLEGTKLEGFTPVAKTDSLQIIDLKEGTGEVVPEGATVTAHYTGALASDGTIFQSSKDTGQPVSFPLTGVIEGWQKGVPGMKVGGTRRLIIPAAQAYGEQAQTGIPANSDLVFDIELVSLGQ